MCKRSKTKRQQTKNKHRRQKQDQQKQQQNKTKQTIAKQNKQQNKQQTNNNNKQQTTEYAKKSGHKNASPPARAPSTGVLGSKFGSFGGHVEKRDKQPATKSMYKFMTDKYKQEKTKQATSLISTKFISRCALWGVSSNFPVDCRNFSVFLPRVPLGTSKLVKSRRPG